MASAKPLPDPQWTDGPQECVACGYSLEGLAVPGKCPECGAPFTAQALVLHGVPRTSTGTPLWRRLVWISLGIVLYVSVQLWPFFIMISWVVPVVGLLASICGMVFMFATGKRERSGVERFMFTQAGVARLAIQREDSGVGTDSVFIPFSPSARLRIDKISPVWRRIRIDALNAQGARKVVFDAGFRCPAEFADRVFITIRAAMSGEPPPALDTPPLHPPLHPPIAPPPLPPR